MATDNQLTTVISVESISRAASSPLAPGVLEDFLKNRPSSLAAVLTSDPTTCFCKLHKPVPHDVKGATDCSCKPISTLPVLAVLYGKRPSRMCHAEPTTRVKDIEFARLALDLTVTSKVAEGGVDPVAVTLFTGAGTSPGSWGPGFCYMQGTLATARWRVGRLLGPECYAVDLLYCWRFALLKQSRRHKVVKVGRGIHIEVDNHYKGADPWSGARLVMDVMAAIREHGDDLRVGMAGGAGIADFVKEKAGLDLDANLETTQLVAYTAATMPASLVDGKNRLKVMAVLGDRQLKVFLAVNGVDRRLTVETLARLESFGQSDKALAAIAVSSGLMDRVSVAAGVDPGSARVGGSALEALVGACFLALGAESTKALVDALDIEVGNAE